MAGAGDLRILRRRIRSVQSTQKITRAMELIAASRITRARQAVELARPYAQGMLRVIRDLAGEQEALATHPMMKPRQEIRRVAVLVICSDRGLAGAYNANILRRADRLIAEERNAGREVDLYLVGRRAETHYRYRGERPTQIWTGVSDRPTYDDAERIIEPLVEAYVAGQIDRLWLAYTDFRSALTQVTTTATVLPIDPEQFGGGEGFPPAFAFEPDPETLLDRLIPRFAEHQLYAALLESSASEHASRQRAMKAATDNAGEMIENLTREANAARQAAITTEISEIVGGAEALAAAE
ncbi:F0F1 ATP synthase subunit gamma [Egibacter rhizosphaerae]|uniref:ATP synthase gamma chain n=1 Tax=Egibacter rhizosphaerae TaxID=1670831 RepID=A0A411YD61_9ACTN|nr:F0F1 ATP synthase subunit gamma [Egibacter rhizosphaerae]QBI19116.1 F0F1 ATP synthase subunit gamma [Egibacter rhizosphaerae]